MMELTVLLLYFVVLGISVASYLDSPASSPVADDDEEKNSHSSSSSGGGHGGQRRAVSPQRQDEEDSFWDAQSWQTHILESKVREIDLSDSCYSAAIERRADNILAFLRRCVDHDATATRLTTSPALRSDFVEAARLNERPRASADTLARVKVWLDWVLSPGEGYEEREGQDCEGWREGGQGSAFHHARNAALGIPPPPRFVFREYDNGKAEALWGDKEGGVRVGDDGLGAVVAKTEEHQRNRCRVLRERYGIRLESLPEMPYERRLWPAVWRRMNHR